MRGTKFLDLLSNFKLVRTACILNCTSGQNASAPSGLFLVSRTGDED